MATIKVEDNSIDNNDEYLRTEVDDSGESDIEVEENNVLEEIYISDMNVHKYVRVITENYYDYIPNNLTTTLTDEQYRACIFFLLFDGIKRMLFNHGTGVGKTVEGSFISLTYLKNNPQAKVLLFIIKATETQWKKQIAIDDIHNVKNRIITIVYDTSSFNNLFVIARQSLRSNQSLLVIIDEMHLFISRSIDKQQTQVKDRRTNIVLQEILKLTSIGTNKLLMLSGTPMTNRIKEFEMYLSILRPKLFDYINSTEIIKTDGIGRVNECINILMYSISSINPQTSFSLTDTPGSDNYAEKRIVEKYIKMDSYQEEFYLQAEEIERKSSASALRFLTRSVGNFCYQLFAKSNLTEKEYEEKNKQSLKEFIGLMKSNMNSLDKIQLMIKCSNKFFSIVNDINEARIDVEGSPIYPKVIVYLTIMSDIDAFISYLEYYNITYVEFSGRTIKTRLDQLAIFNSDDNYDGHLIRVIILSAAGSIGVNILGVTRVYLASEPWTDASAGQVIGRSVRYKAHLMIPPEHRIVKIFIYLSTFNTIERNTADQAIYASVKRKYNVLSVGLNILIKASYESQQQIESTDEYIPIMTSYLLNKIKVLKRNVIKDAIDKYYLSKYNYSIQTVSVDEYVTVRQIMYQVNDQVYEGYIYDNNIYSSDDELVCNIKFSKPKIRDNKLIYIISND